MATNNQSMDLTPSPRLLAMLGEVPFDPWQCFAELIDNGFDDFLGTPDGELPESPTVKVTLPSSTAKGAVAEVRDNGRGMSFEQLENSLRAGYSGQGAFDSLGLFGMGFNVATARLGRRTTIRTSRAGAAEWLETTIDFDELQKADTFRVPVKQIDKEDVGESGTAVIVQLKPDMANALAGRAHVEIQKRLGDVYSYLLRTSVPGLSGEVNGPLGFKLFVNDDLVEPSIPCIWSDERETTYRGAQIRAVQYIDVPLISAWACNMCGNWVKEPEPVECNVCGYGRLEPRDRRIWGWLGVQRYIDTAAFGISLLRNGRKIKSNDQSFFVWEDPDTGARDVEYPIEMPSNRGRLVGEIHVDHIRPTYQKNGFDESTQDWYALKNAIRGNLPLKERTSKARGGNDSPLAKLFSAFRRNDPGVKCLTPGTGEKAVHDLPVQWAKSFKQGLDEYQTDAKWWEAAVEHDRIKNELSADGSSTDTTGDGEGSIGAQLIGVGKKGDPPDPPKPPSKVETNQDKFDRYRIGGRKRHELSADLQVASLSPISVETFVYRAGEVQDKDGNPVAVTSMQGVDQTLMVVVNPRHDLFIQFGRDIADAVLLEVAQFVHGLRGSAGQTVLQVFQEVLEKFPDQELTHAVMVERQESLRRRLIERIVPIAEQDADSLWAGLSNDDKERVQGLAMSENPQLDWKVAVESGEFANHLDLRSVASLARALPESLFDGQVFLPSVSGLDEAPATQQIATVALPLEQIAIVLDSAIPPSSPQLQLLRVFFNMALDQISDD
jgi:hypothetical protein